MTSSDTTQTMEMMARPRQEHQWLKKFLGEWTVEGRMAEPGQPEQTYTGQESYRALGDLWIVGESSGDMPDGNRMIMIEIFGYDPDKQRFVGSQVMSVMPQMWIYEGMLDEAGNALTMDSTGPDMFGDRPEARYQDVMEFESDDHRILTSYVFEANGERRQIHQAHYRRA